MHDTLMKRMKSGHMDERVQAMALAEGINPETLAEAIAAGRVCAPSNALRPRPLTVAIGEGLRVKTNVNVGVSDRLGSFESELAKVSLAVRHGADALMDLSSGHDSGAFRRRLVEDGTVPVGTVPLYDAASAKAIEDLSADDFFAAAERHAQCGVDFETIHVGLTLQAAQRLYKSQRVTGIVSRGGWILYEWMRRKGKENPFAADFGRLLELCRRYDLTLSLGDGMRPGSIADASDAAQIQELILLGEFAAQARAADVQVMIEGPGHIPLHEVEANVVLAKKLCGGAPFYVLGPLVCDTAPGYDHITAAIGGALAAKAGADFLCVVTPAEHLRLPDEADILEGLMAARIAAHAADLARGKGDTEARNRAMSKARAALDWPGMYANALDPHKAKSYRAKEADTDGESCSMCGELCPMKRAQSLAAHL